ncbi:Down syndrome cell adhesion molecule-like protein [Armadillidium nasatum]|uniref:Down syndrome cell adhesion molecule-like protein n=1 Tax=Armadillidium nasatum TaxID=96803 RepID=A0A5N5T0F6_9CRUS|nr:Down syndrome cell adhesion molecule-like protein [Armadillidium nasatum]
MSSSGSSVSCKAKGIPTPSVSWYSENGLPVSTIPGIREVFMNGTLHFPALRNSVINSGNHDSFYYCQASNTRGTIVSKDVHVRRVIDHQWEIRVYDQYVIEGNTAVMVCEVPMFVQDYVTVTSWAQGHRNFFPGQEIGNVFLDFSYR